jgi:D-tagatose-1,6-bisphosphate aldolase subunit GatZ/KbaZ
MWKNEPAAKAMQTAKALVRDCVAAGFHKIHLDTGSGCADDPKPDLPLAVSAQRAVALCKAAETAAQRLPPKRPRPLYVIGAEVPPPGGALENPDRVEVTRPEAVVQTIVEIEAGFRTAGLENAWERVMAVVVQPGVEFGDDCVAAYRSSKALPLAALHAGLPGIMTYEVHSTDYQTAEALREMTRDHFILMKVGPCLTYAYREAVFALAHIESEWLTDHKGIRLSGIRPCLERVMREMPTYWQSHYGGPSDHQKLMRAYSYRDRIRYYWQHPSVAKALDRLFANLSRPIPSSLLRQYFPDLYPAIGSGQLAADPLMLIERRIQQALAPYVEACR